MERAARMHPAKRARATPAPAAAKLAACPSGPSRWGTHNLAVPDVPGCAGRRTIIIMNFILIRGLCRLPAAIPT
jgi:hypothetical protein